VATKLVSHIRLVQHIKILAEKRIHLVHINYSGKAIDGFSYYNA
jgi:hypothetical protein